MSLFLEHDNEYRWAWIIHLPYKSTYLIFLKLHWHKLVFFVFNIPWNRERGHFFRSWSNKTCCQSASMGAAIFMNRMSSSCVFGRQSSKKKTRWSEPWLFAVKTIETFCRAPVRTLDFRFQKVLGKVFWNFLAQVLWFLPQNNSN